MKSLEKGDLGKFTKASWENWTSVWLSRNSRQEIKGYASEVRIISIGNSMWSKTYWAHGRRKSSRISKVGLELYAWKGTNSPGRTRSMKWNYWWLSGFGVHIHIGELGLPISIKQVKYEIHSNVLCDNWNFIWLIDI